MAQIDKLIQRGSEQGVFRSGVDPVQLYISIAALGYFYRSNIHTLSTVFDTDLSHITLIQERESHAVNMVLDHLRTQASQGPEKPG